MRRLRDGTAVISGSVVLFTPNGGDDQWGFSYVDYTISDGRGGTASSAVEIFIIYGEIIAFANADFYRVEAESPSRLPMARPTARQLRPTTAFRCGFRSARD